MAKNEIGDSVRNWREAHSFSQSALAAVIGVGQPQLSDFERIGKPLGEAAALMLQRVTSGEVLAVNCVSAVKRNVVAALTGEWL